PSDMATALAHVQQPVPDIGGERPSLPPELVSVVSGLLVKDRDRRIGSALELGGALQTVRSRLGLPSSEPGANLRVAGPRAGAPQVPGSAGEVPTSGAVPTGNGKGRAHANGLAAAGNRVAVGDKAGAAAKRGGKAAVHAGAPGKARRAPGHEDRTLLDRGRAPSPMPVKRRRARTGTVVVLLLLVAGAAVAVAVLTTGSRPGSHGSGQGSVAGNNPGSSASPSGAPLKVTAVRELTQNGLGPDHVSMLPNLIAPGAKGGWTSYIYRGPDFGHYGGLGIVFQMSGDPVVHSVRVTTATSGWSAEVFAGPSDASTVAAWGAPLARQSDIAGSTTFSLGAKKAEWVLLWMLDPGPTYHITLNKVVFH
ncbi:MAG TPA: hypothetical protein VFN61_16410, partial [Acidimicrobiales bacterium]|nr:hypothetical protein [Acidimicrobiales bacterium]